MCKYTKLLLLQILLLHTCFITANINSSISGSSKSTTMKIGYTEGGLNLNLGTSIRVIIKGAIQFPESYMQKLKGNKITSIRLAIGKELSEQNNTIFITNNLEKQPLYIQKIEKFEAGWNDITLDTPFNISGEELFIGFQYTSSGEVISFDGSADNNYANWLAHGQKEEDLSWTHQPGGCLNLQAIINGDHLPQNDVCLNNISARKYAHPGMESPIDLIIRNMAAADINNLEVTYTVEDQEPVTRLIENLSIKSNDIGMVSLDDMIIDESGIYNLDIKINKVNGEIDEDDTNNTGYFENIICKEDYTNRKVLLEQFSTMECINCPDAHKTLDNALKYKRDVIRIIHHSGYGTDALTIDESSKYLFFFSNESGGNHYAPGMMLDRTNLTKYGADNGNGGSTPGPAFFPRRENVSKLIDQCMSTPALISLNMNKKYDANTRSLTVSAFGQIPSGDVSRLKGSNICLNIVLTEDNILGTQIGADNPNEYYHSHAIRKVLTSVWGDPIEFTGDTFHSKDYTFTIPAEWVDKNMHVIAFIANRDQISSNNCQVYNSEEATLLDPDPSSIESNQQETGPKIYANTIAGYIYVSGEYNSASIYNTAGCLIKQINQPKSEIDICSLSEGIYFIKLHTADSSYSFKFIITR